jgi:hypothetical protein
MKAPHGSSKDDSICDDIRRRSSLNPAKGYDCGLQRVNSARNDTLNRLHHGRRCCDRINPEVRSGGMTGTASHNQTQCVG